MVEILDIDAFVRELLYHLSLLKLQLLPTATCLAIVNEFLSTVSFIDRESEEEAISSQSEGHAASLLSLLPLKPSHLPPQQLT